MPIRSGNQYINSLRDGRRLQVDGKLVTDVTQYPPFQGVIDTIASIYDDQFDPKLGPILTYKSPKTGDIVSATYIEPYTADELKHSTGCYYLRASRTYGLMGRLTDFMSAMLIDQAVGLRAMGRTEAAERAQWIVDYSRENDLQVTHALIDPQSDRSKTAAPSEAVRILERRPDGIVVSGCRLLSTLAPVANECYVGPYYPRKPGEEDYALAFQIPMNAEGLTILARESFHHGQAQFDRPLTSRFDEGDAILMFDKVFVPYERVVLAGDIEAYNGMVRAGGGLLTLQASIRSTVKLRFLTGLATVVARANGRDKTPRCQAAIGELVGLVAVADGLCSGITADCLRRMQAIAKGAGPVVGDGLSEPRAMGGYGGAALNFFFPYSNTKAIDVLRMVAGSGVLSMSEADYADPYVGQLMDKWLIGPNTTAKDRLRLMKLAWDMTGSEFGSRAGLYERYYSGDPEQNALRWFSGPFTGDCVTLVEDFLKLAEADEKSRSSHAA